MLHLSRFPYPVYVLASCNVATYVRGFVEQLTVLHRDEPYSSGDKIPTMSSKDSDRITAAQQTLDSMSQPALSTEGDSRQ